MSRSVRSGSSGFLSPSLSNFTGMGTGTGNIDNRNDYTVANPAHPIAAGLSGTGYWTTFLDSIEYITVGSEAIPIVHAPGDTSQQMVVALRLALIWAWPGPQIVAPLHGRCW